MFADFIQVPLQNCAVSLENNSIDLIRDQGFAAEIWKRLTGKLLIPVI